MSLPPATISARPKRTNKTMKRFDEIIGRQYLQAAHFNDSKVDLGSRKDRHDSIGRGKLGMEAFALLDERCPFR